MKKILLALVVISMAMPTMAQKSKKKQSKDVKSGVVSSLEQEDPEEKLQKAASLEGRMIGPMHHLLVQNSGHWRDEVKVFSGSKSEPSVTRWERDGRIEMEGKFLNYSIIGVMGNERYEAHSTIGFDNLKRKFVKTWYDNFSSSILVLEGALDEKSGAINFEGTTIDPVTRMPVKVYQTQTNPNPNSQFLEIFVEAKDGQKIKTMEINSTRG